MDPVFALFAPDRAIERRERQTCTHIYRPDNGDPTHRIIATNSEILFGSWIANLTEGHLRTGNKVANVNLLIWGYPRNFSFHKKPLTYQIFASLPIYGIFGPEFQAASAD